MDPEVIAMAHPDAHASTSCRAGHSLVRRSLCGLALLALSGLLAGCNMIVMNPAGDVAVQQRNLIVASTVLMLLVIVPVIALTFLFAWRYRASNTEATYDPEFHHSTQLEVVIWTVPLLIIIALGAMTWISTHTLDPFRPLSRLGPNRPVPAGVKPLEVQVGRARLEVAVHLPGTRDRHGERDGRAGGQADLVQDHLVLGVEHLLRPGPRGMIYAMPGMETKLHAVINKPGDFTGLSGHYSGPGFSRMNFAFRSVSEQGFDEWVAKAKAAGTPLDRDTYLKLEKPSEAEPVRYYGALENGIFEAILGMCVAPGQMCVREMHHIDRMGGAAQGSEANRRRLDYDNRRVWSGHEPSGATVPASGRPAKGDVQPEGMMPRDQERARGGVNEPQTAPDQGQGNALPGADRAPAPAQLNTQPTAPAPPALIPRRASACSRISISSNSSSGG